MHTTRLKTTSAENGWLPVVSRLCGSCRQQRECFLSTRLRGEGNTDAQILRKRYQLLPGDRLFHRNARFTSLFQVCSGSVKTQRDTHDGGLLVTGFYLSGDVVGIEAIGGTQYPDDAVAITEAIVCQLDIERLLMQCNMQPEVNAWMIQQVGDFVRRRESDLVWSTSLPSDRRTLRFFLDLYQRLAGDTDDPDDMCRLPMRKQDIAHYLRITPETLSRNLGMLRRKALLAIDQDRFVIPDTARAEALTRL